MVRQWRAERAAKAAECRPIVNQDEGYWRMAASCSARVFAAELGSRDADESSRLRATTRGKTPNEKDRNEPRMAMGWSRARGCARETERKAWLATSESTRARTCLCLKASCSRGKERMRRCGSQSGKECKIFSYLD